MTLAILIGIILIIASILFEDERVKLKLKYEREQNKLKKGNSCLPLLDQIESKYRFYKGASIVSVIIGAILILISCLK